MPSQILFLIDLDQSLPLRHDKAVLLDNFSRLRRILLRQLVQCSELSGLNPLKPNSARFSFRFYSSTGYFVPPSEMSSQFDELNQVSFDKLLMQLSDHLDKVMEVRDKTNSFDVLGFEKHLQSQTRKSEAFNLRKSLEEIAILYDWDSPNLTSPVKRLNFKGARSQSQNFIFVFTKFPDTWSEVGRYFNSNQTAEKVWKHRDVFRELLAQQNAKKITSLLKGDQEVCLKLVDTTEFYRTDSSMVVDPRVKETFEHAFRAGMKSSVEFVDIVKYVNELRSVGNCFQDWFLPSEHTSELFIMSKVEEGRKIKEKLSAKLLKKLQEFHGPKFQTQKKKCGPVESKVASSAAAILSKIPEKRSNLLSKRLQGNENKPPQSLKRKNASPDLGGNPPKSRRRCGLVPVSHPMVNIDFNKRDKVKPFTASKIKLDRLPRRSARKKNPNHNSNNTSKVLKAKKTKRNLCFDLIPDEKSSKKQMSLTALERTPKKANNTSSRKIGTPKQLTPNKVHTVLVPETPNVKKKRKSDGTVFVSETPEKSNLAASTSFSTPRTKKVRESVRLRTFYDGNKKLSRNVLKNERENLQNSCLLPSEQKKKEEKLAVMSLKNLFPHLISPPNQEVSSSCNCLQDKTSCTCNNNTTPSRPSRQKTVVNRFGIDDVILGAYVSPNSRTKKKPVAAAKTPESRKKVDEKVTDANIPEVQETPNKILAGTSTSETHNTPILRKTPIRKTPIQNTPVRKTPISDKKLTNATEVSKTPVRKTPVKKKLFPDEEKAGNELLGKEKCAVVTFVPNDSIEEIIDHVKLEDSNRESQEMTWAIARFQEGKSMTLSLSKSSDNTLKYRDRVSRTSKRKIAEQLNQDNSL